MKKTRKDTYQLDPEMKEKVHLFVTGELEESEHKEVFDWIDSNPRNRLYYNELHAVLRTVEYFGSEKKVSG